MTASTGREAVMPLNAPQSDQRNKLLDVDNDVLAEKFGNRSFLVNHELNDHPLFEIPELLKLAKSLPEKDVWFNAGDIPFGEKWSTAGKNATTLEDAVGRIDQSGSWVILKNVHQDKRIQELVDQGFGDVEEALGRPIRSGVTQLAGFIFLASPGAVTPFHIDAESTFLMQIQGSKTVSVVERDDRDMLTRPEIESFYAGQEEAASFKPDYESHAVNYKMPPGTGVHLPAIAPHWVKNDDNVSVSFAISFVLPADRARRRIYVANGYMRKYLKTNPADPGDNVAWDRVREAAGGAALQLRKTFLGS